MNKVILTVAVTGGQTTREQHPKLPITPEEIAQAAYECYNEGAAIVHIHVRDPKTGGRSMNLDYYTEAVERLKAKCDMVINLSTGPGGQLAIGPDNLPMMEQSVMASPEKRVEHIVKLKPELCSLDIGSSNAGFGVFVNAQVVVDRMADMIKQAGVKPEVEIFDTGHIQIARRLIGLDLLEKNAHFQLCMGTRMGVPATMKDAVHISESLPGGATWSIFGVGPAHFPMVAAGVLLGGHVRVGFEDNVFLTKGRLAASNAELARHAVTIMRTLFREPATVEETRQLLGL
ncbi:MAG: 3-keto-5-aminohexanoate cleavage protein [Syntrophales bacterium]|nr:3-keto-5-aminohexanoate cleavage protein [Syntrophales bacterium]